MKKSLIKVLLLITASVVLFLYNYRVCGFNFICFPFHYNYMKAKISPGIHYRMFLSKKVESRRLSSRLINYFKKCLQQSAHLANYSKVNLSYYG